MSAEKVQEAQDRNGYHRFHQASRRRVYLLASEMSRVLAPVLRPQQARPSLPLVEDGVPLLPCHGGNEGCTQTCNVRVQERTGGGGKGDDGEDV